MAKKPLRIADALGFGSSAKPYASPYLREVSKIKPGQKLPGTITRAPRPSAATELAQLLTPNTRFGNDLAAKIAGAVDYSPLSVLTGFVDARRAYQAGNVGNAASTGLLAALGAIPGGKGAKVAKDIAETAAERGIIAYHGSPHSFDRFDISKIGTGEGAQAYGHGLYFAEAEDVAKNYRNALARPDPGDMVGNAYDLVRILGEKDALENLKGLNSKEAIATAKAITSGAYKKYKPPGSMYQVRINANPEDFADWDKPFFEQPKSIQDAIEYAFGPQPTFGRFGSYSMDKPREMHTQLMSEKGVKGIKYLDQGSRGAGEGSSNYVVFDDALIEILKKYGIAIPALAGGGLLAAQTQQDGGL